MWSKTKIGAGLVGISAIFASVGGWLNGAVQLNAMVTAVIASIGAVVTAWGIRDWPIINRGVK